MAGKRKERDLIAPDITEDAAERKRVLNVLAQRRYRQRRKDRIQALEAQLKSVGPHNEEITAPEPEQGRGGTGLPTDVLSPFSTPVTLGESDIIASDYEDEGITTSAGAESCPAGTASGFNDITLVPEAFTELFLPAAPHLLPSELSTLASPFLASISPRTPGQASLDSLVSTSGAPLDVSPLPLFPGPENSTQDHSNGDYVQFTSLLSNPESTNNISDDLQDYQSSNFTFPDDHLLQVPSLTLLSAAVRVAQRLGIENRLWDMAAVSPFYRPRVHAQSSTSSPPSSLPPSSISSTTWIRSSQTSDGDDTTNIDLETLPDHLRPTRTQVLISHHPILDLLPWPTARDKLIQVFNLPVNLRPKSAQDPMGLVRLVYDMEDVGGEGIRVHSSDPFEMAGWEIGQLMFERWWWAFETDTVKRSNRRRIERGEKCLELS
ncbi:hypothetical protein BDV35DRAFT_351970 [Aspergillus flavus]|uniref:BZIP domain-containing protein n=2 Tax=Aspergillus subgen. Circumdati TaxID=2720871 RepID=A0A5N6GZ82_ASPFL|nr:hypothetical protein Ao3042_07193 [Aspergillus oryzae 3.042]KAB8247167.1 hypothetical protein BDV35DRAFT_351970 [Aspergillus flavus]KDE80249.1 hypothetical protein AO1008_06604 [Aspergillus oryzae 100-8]|eukprot:EIT76641.1 hypothetical protein Ao3042_07193 [Aspergillus oryzae 3.042]